MSTSVSDLLTAIKSDLDEALKASSWWKRFIGSQFVAFLSLYISKAMERTARVAERALQESFLSLATTRASILAGAEDAGYVGRKISPSVGKALAINEGNSRLTLPSYGQCVSGGQVRYTIIDELDLSAGESKEVAIQQFEVTTLTHIVTESVSWQSILFDQDITEQIHNVVVRVNGERWAHFYKFRGAVPSSKAYMEYYKSTDQLGIRFGNGINGAMPQVDDVITFELWLTAGETTLLDGQELELVDHGTVVASNYPLKITTTTTVMGGAEGEDIESIRSGALYSTVYDGQLTWDGDYTTYIKNIIADISWLSVWGESEQEKLVGKYSTSHINTIYISGHSTGKDESILKEQILALFAGREGFNEKYTYVDRVEVPYTVDVIGTVVGGSSPDDVEKEVIELLGNKFGYDSDRSNVAYSHQIWREIEAHATDLEIIQFKVVATGLLNAVPVNTFHFLDVENSSIRFTY